VGEGDLGLSTVESIWMGILDRTPCRSRTAPRERRVVPWVSQFPRASSHLSLSLSLFRYIFSFVSIMKAVVCFDRGCY
jgi:hypothetical protein